jgi:hypothetical protein
VPGASGMRDRQRLGGRRRRRRPRRPVLVAVGAGLRPGRRRGGRRPCWRAGR